MSYKIIGEALKNVLNNQLSENEDKSETFGNGFNTKMNGNFVSLYNNSGDIVLDGNEYHINNIRYINDIVYNIETVSGFRDTDTYLYNIETKKMQNIPEFITKIRPFYINNDDRCDKHIHISGDGFESIYDVKSGNIVLDGKDKGYTNIREFGNTYYEIENSDGYMTFIDRYTFEDIINGFELYVVDIEEDNNQIEIKYNSPDNIGKTILTYDTLELEYGTPINIS